MGPSESAHGGTASKQVSEGSRSRAQGDARRRLIFAAERRPDHGRKRVEGILLITLYRGGQIDKPIKLERRLHFKDMSRGRPRDRSRPNSHFLDCPKRVSCPIGLRDYGQSSCR